ncbi:hypothetical protein KY308_04465 [Candidatus Woesearchaeota archaeon]|nr:hypothetical protein [Candidatus Woesearchaeota archaeon]
MAKMVGRKIAPLSGSFMLASMLGFAISLVWVYPASKGFGVSFMIIFAAMFVASLISLRRAPVEDLLAQESRKK